MSAYEQAIFLNHNRYQDWVDKGSDPKNRPENQKHGIQMMNSSI